MTCSQSSGFCTGACGGFIITATPADSVVSSPIVACDPVYVYRDDDGDNTIEVVNDNQECDCDCEYVYRERESSSDASSLAGGALFAAGVAMLAL